MARVSVLLCLVLLVTLGVVISFSFAHNTEVTSQHQESSKTAATLDHVHTKKEHAIHKTGDQHDDSDGEKKKHGHKKKGEDSDDETDSDDDSSDDDTDDDTDDDDDDKKKKKTVKAL
ncbi:hypothetical protein N665_0787s0003 [Sinapis alba]|nr:hypothetical protein N665_0787s0003 [Sinapis alba]